MRILLGYTGKCLITATYQGENLQKVGVERILKLLNRENIQATFFIPGHTADNFVQEVLSIKDAGHEIANHGYIHEPPNELKNEEEAKSISKGIETIEKITGVRTQGYRSPFWNLSRHTLKILERLNFSYDSSLMANDFTPYRPNNYIEVDSERKVKKRSFKAY